MKNSFLLIGLVCAFFLPVKAQTEAGKKLLGGTLGFSLADDESRDAKSQSNNINIAPYFGFFAHNNLALAISVGYSNYYTDYTDIGPAANKAYNTTQNMLTITPFVRYYGNLTGKFKFYAQLNVYTGFGTAHIRYNDPAMGHNANLMIKQHGAGLLPGISYFPNANFALECAFSGFSYSTWSFTDAGNAKLQGNKTLSVGINSFTPNIGLNYYF